MVSSIIPIVPESRTCPGLGELQVREPVVLGDTERGRKLLDILHADVLPCLEPPGPVGAWLRTIRLDEGEAEVRVARELGCRTVLVSSVAFDTLRRLLPDCDIYVRPEDPPG